MKEFTDPQMVSMGYTAEMVARKYGIEVAPIGGGRASAEGNG